jgi:hypothetical protein
VSSPIGGAISAVALVVFLILTVVLIVQLIVILIMKALQTVLLAAQFMFAPVFLIFFATPDTESVASAFIKSCVEVSLWTFVWVGLLKLMVILLFSLFSPWGKIIMAIAILQLMIQVPSFLARASISPISVLSASNFMTTGLKMNAARLGSTLVEKSLSLASELTNNKNGDFAARQEAGMSQRVEKPTPPPFDNTFARGDVMAPVATSNQTALAIGPAVIGHRVLNRPFSKHKSNNSIAHASDHRIGTMPSAARAAHVPISPPIRKAILPLAKSEDPIEAALGDSSSSVGALYQSARAAIDYDNASTPHLNSLSTCSPAVQITDELLESINSIGTEGRQTLESNGSHILVPTPMLESFQRPTRHKTDDSSEAMYDDSLNSSLENTSSIVGVLYQSARAANEANGSISSSRLSAVSDPISIEASRHGIVRDGNYSISMHPKVTQLPPSKRRGEIPAIAGATPLGSDYPDRAQSWDRSTLAENVLVSGNSKEGRLKLPPQAPQLVENPVAPASIGEPSGFESSLADSGSALNHNCQSSPCRCNDMPQLPPLPAQRASDIRNEPKEVGPFAQSYSGFESEQ